MKFFAFVLLAAGLSALPDAQGSSPTAAAGSTATAAVSQGLSSTARLMSGAESYVEGDAYYVVGSSSASDQEKARRKALKDAAEKAGALLEKEGLGAKRSLTQGIENAAMRESALRALKLGKVRVEGQVYERWANEAGKDEWKVRLLISIRKK